MDFKSINLKVGLEIHQQLDTHKLFCSCSSEMSKMPYSVIERKQHPIQSELGEVDIASQYEYLRNRKFYYEIFPHETCLVELDEEPPHSINQEALKTALQIAVLLNCEIPEEIHVMRKSIIDGSTPSSFQRTMVVGLNGFLKFRGQKIGISHVSLEEDAASALKEEDGKIFFRLNRVGIPLVEISTETLSNFTPQDIQEIAYQIGLITRSTRKVKRGIGTIRQDLNVSVKNGERVEIKGVQDLGLLAKVVENEANRQLKLPKVKKEVRGALPDGTTKFLRPLPGAARMYPETDLVPILISREETDRIKKELPEPMTSKLEKFEKKMSSQLAEQIIRSEYLDLFELILTKFKVDASIVANTFLSTLKDLEKREKVKVENLKEEHFMEVFDYLEKGRIVKEAIPQILKFFAENPKSNIHSAIEKLHIKPLSDEELEKIVREVQKQFPENADKIIGVIMSKVRGRIEARKVIETVKRIVKK